LDVAGNDQDRRTLLLTTRQCLSFVVIAFVSGETERPQGVQLDTNHLDGATTALTFSYRYLPSNSWKLWGPVGTSPSNGV